MANKVIMTATRDYSISYSISHGPVGVMLQLLSSAEDARMRTRYTQMSGEEKQGG